MSYKKNRNRFNKSEYSMLMNNQSKKDPDIPDKSSDEQVEKKSESKLDLAKSNKLVFFKKYYTYQALLEVCPENDLSTDGCFAKTILYIMRWFRNRLGDEVYDAYPETAFLKEVYPEPDHFADFDLEASENINGFSFIDFETAYINKKSAWLVCLTEPDNGIERNDIHGRTFVTEIFVYRKEDSVVLGIRESCREPVTNQEDASGFRPGFVRDMFYDKDLIISEYGLGRRYAFLKHPFMLNGKSKEACEDLFNELIISDNRQMPILFVPGEYYEKNRDEVDSKTKSLLGFAHVVVWEGSSAKLFGQTMASEELMEVANEGQLIFYRTTALQDYPSSYYESDVDGILEEIKLKAQKEPYRKNWDYKGYRFRPAWWGDDIAEESKSDDSDVEELKAAYEKELSKLSIQLKELKVDNEGLQRKIDSLESENKKLDKTQNKAFSDLSKYREYVQRLDAEINNEKEKRLKAEADLKTTQILLYGQMSSERERYTPIINLPSVTKDIREDIVEWIQKYYSDTIELHPNAVKSLKDDNRNIDWHRLCMMIHFLSGYTKYRNDGGQAISPDAARDHDPEESGYMVEPVNSGQGSTVHHKDKYTISVGGQDVLMDMHLKYGKGKDANMIRVYFYYDPESKKSIIGYMPGHLPTRADAH